MGLFGGFKKKEATKKEPEYCDCCGSDITDVWFLVDSNVDPSDSSSFEERKYMAENPAMIDTIGSEYKAFKFKFGDKKICGHCLTKVFLDMTNKYCGPAGFLLLEEFKVNHIRNVLTEMPIEEMKNRVNKIDEELEATKKTKEEKELAAQNEWMNSLK